jgi:hypothetical protein
MGLFRKGGGFLSNVDGTIQDYQFTDEFNGEPFKAGKNAKGGDKFHSLFGFLTVRVDGASEDVTVNLFAGGFDDYEVSEDGYSVDRQLGNGAFSTFIESMVEASAELGEKLEALGGLNFQPIIGARVRFIQVVNAEATKRLGKVKDKKTGKETYDRKDLQIETVYSLAEGKKAAGKPVKAAKGKAAVADTSDVEQLAGEALTEILSDNGGSITLQKLSMAVLKNMLKRGVDEDVRESVRKTALSVDFLETADSGYSYDAKSKTISFD